jgi:hypothetical protein
MQRAPPSCISRDRSSLRLHLAIPSDLRDRCERYSSSTRTSLGRMRSDTTGGCISSQSRQVHPAYFPMHRPLSGGSTVTMSPPLAISRAGEALGGFSSIGGRRRRRGAFSRQAEGFVLASTTLPPGPQLERIVALARLVATLDRRQSPAALVRLAHRGAMWPNKLVALRLAAIWLCSDAKA